MSRSSQPSGLSSNHLGLSICKKLCEKLGGSISIESKLNRGTTVTFRMQVEVLNQKIRQKRAKKVKSNLVIITEESKDNYSEGEQDQKEESPIKEVNMGTNEGTKFRGVVFGP